MLTDNLTVGGLLRRTAAAHPDRPALIHQDQTFTYLELDTFTDRYACSLLQLGVRKGDHVGILCEAEPNCIFLMYAVTRIGAVAVMLNTSLLQDELTARIATARIRWLLIGDGYKEVDYPTVCAGLPDRAPTLQAIRYIGLQDRTEFPPLLPDGTADLSPVTKAESAVDPQDTAFILFTSGTGSTPKAVMSSHYSRVNSGILQAKDLAADCTDRFCTAMPVFHCFSLSVNVLAACAVGACLYLPASRRTSDLLAAIQTGKCTVFSCVPALFRAILRREDFETWDLSSLRTGFIGGSSYPEALFAEIEERMGFTLLSSLGQTEATAGITTARLDDPLSVRATTIGHFMDHVEGRILDPVTDEPLPVGTPGEICVRGYVVMQGYCGQPEETAKAIDQNGFLHTGDVGWLDQDGNIHLSGRLKELIIRGGENISPKEIESVFFDDDRVSACKAVGIPDEHYGEEVCLCVVPADESCDEAYVRGKLSEKLAAYKMPRYVRFFDALPMTATGKIRLQALKEMVSR